MNNSEPKWTQVNPSETKWTRVNPSEQHCNTTHNYTSIKIHKFTSTKVKKFLKKYKGTQLCKYTSTQIYKYPMTQVHKLTSIQVYRNIHKCLYYWEITLFQKITAVGATSVGVTAVKNNLKFKRILPLDLPSFSDYPCYYSKYFCRSILNKNKK